MLRKAGGSCRSSFDFKIQDRDFKVKATSAPPPNAFLRTLAKEETNLSENEPRNAGAQQRNRNADVHQDRNSAAKSERAVFDNIGLTKRNADYMYRFNQALQEQPKLSVDKKSEIVNQMVADLQEGQRTGKIAKNLFGGDVHARVKEIVEGPKRDASAPDPYWPSALYNGLWFFTIFSLMFGILYIVSPSAQKNGSPVGITSIILSGVIAGLALPAIPRMFDSKRKHSLNLWIRILLAILFVVAWLVLFYGMAYLPGFLNPVMTPWAQLVLGVLTGVGAWFVKQHYDLRQGFFSGNTQRRR